MADQNNIFAPGLFEELVGVMFVGCVTLENASVREVLEEIDGQRQEIIGRNVLHLCRVGAIIGFLYGAQDQPHQGGRRLHHRGQIDKVRRLDDLAVVNDHCGFTGERGGRGEGTSDRAPALDRARRPGLSGRKRYWWTWWRGLDSNQRRLSQRIYSPSPLTTRAPLPGPPT